MRDVNSQRVRVEVRFDLWTESPGIVCARQSDLNLKYNFEIRIFILRKTLKFVEPYYCSTGPLSIFGRESPVACG